MTDNVCSPTGSITSTILSRASSAVFPWCILQWMCGIAGKISFGSSLILKEDLMQMSDKIAHRGPDDEGVFVSGNRRVGLVSRRLAILDLSERGHQPMGYKNKYWIVFNGEIYNFQEEAAKLAKKGYKFRSRSDTEVILALYHEYGVDCLSHLRGMFAFAIFDTRKNQIFLARDRVGKKPLKYYWDKKTFIFASELKSILSQKEVRTSPDWLAIHYYLTFGYCPSPMTGFEKISKLDPASYMLIDLENGEITKHKYWQPDFNHKLHLSETEWSEMILKELEESVKLRMISDVPVGAFLSGGVDSSAVVALMARNSSQAIKTFTIGFDDEKSDERKYAKTIAHKFGTDHLELVVSPQSIELLPEIVKQYEEPFADGSAVISYMICQLAGKFVKVVLNGDGSDESFCGYLRHNKLARDYVLGRVPWIFSALGNTTSMWPRGKRFVDRQKVDIRDRYLEYNCYFTRSEKLELYGKRMLGFATDNSAYDLWKARCNESSSSDVRDALIFADLEMYLADSQLAKMDIASMSASLEARSPFADHKMIELTAKIPYNLKVKGGVNKYILKKALEGVVPHENLYRKKMGFSIPLDRWFSGELNEYMTAQIKSKKSIVRLLFTTEEVQRMLSSHSIKSDYGPKLWSLLTLDLWYRQYF